MHLNQILLSSATFHPSMLFSFFPFFEFYICECSYPCMSVCCARAWGLQRPEESNGYPGSRITNGHSRVWVLGVKSRSSGRAASAFLWQAIISSPGLLDFHYITCHCTSLSTTYHLSPITLKYEFREPQLLICLTLCCAHRPAAWRALSKP